MFPLYDLSSCVLSWIEMSVQCNWAMLWRILGVSWEQAWRGNPTFAKSTTSCYLTFLHKTKHAILPESRTDALQSILQSRLINILIITSFARDQCWSLQLSLLMYGPVCPGTCLMLSINSVRLNYNLYLSCHYPILTLCVISSWYSSLFYNSWYFHFTFMLYQTSLLFSPFIFWAPLSLLSTVSLLGGSKFISYCGLIHLFYISVYLELLVKKTCSLTKFYYNSPL